jgi:SAM-dependent methyltransferase
VCSQAVLEAVGQDRRCFARRVLDVGGGAGHLTRSLGQLAGPGTEVVLADVALWKVWLAKRFVAPACQPVCCDANAPLPFAGGAFSLAVCSDAFHYVWSRRLLAAELVRAVGPDGIVLLTHLHNLLCENVSAGMPLAPGDYRNLFERVGTRLFKESDVFAAVLDHRPVDLSPEYADEDLSGEPALILLATRLMGFFRRYERPPPGCAAVGRPGMNPLYAVEEDGRVLKLRFPSPAYEAEFAACKRYLPDRVAWGEDRQARLRAGVLDGELTALARRRVLLDLPAAYC